jgi:hypothetical protein
LHLKFQLYCSISVHNDIDSFMNVNHNTWRGNSKCLFELDQIHLTWNLSLDRVFNSPPHLAILSFIFLDCLVIRNRTSSSFFVIAEDTYWAWISRWFSPSLQIITSGIDVPNDISLGDETLSQHVLCGYSLNYEMLTLFHRFWNQFLCKWWVDCL